MAARTIKFTLYVPSIVCAASCAASEQPTCEKWDDQWGRETCEACGGPLEEGSLETEFELPARFEICDRCDGEGKHVNPNIDGHGITADEWERDWSDEEREGYFRGDYDVACEARCHDGKELVIDLDACSAEQKALAELHEEHQAEVAQWDREDAHTRRMESGGY